MRVISFSVFGPDRMYSAGAIANARLSPEVYPGWVCRFYLGRSVCQEDRSVLDDMPHVQIVDMPGAEDWSGVMWRFLALRDPEIDAHLFRDADSRLSLREASAVTEWLNSGRNFHIMRDHPQHWIEILAGMWGCTAAGAGLLRDLLPDPLWNSQPYVDQWWLRDLVYPMARTDAMIHDSFDMVKGEDPRPFPTPRVPGEFVAQGFTADGSLRVPGDALLVA